MKRLRTSTWVFAAIAVAIPIADILLKQAGLGRWAIGNEMAQRVLIFTLLGLGLNVVVGYTGLLHLGVAAFMAIGVYAHAIFTCSIYPFQFGFWISLLLAPLVGVVAGVILGTPTLRLRGDYLAIVTLGFGEITQDVIKNLDVITKGAQGINPVPPPHLPGYTLEASSYVPWYLLYLGILVVVIWIVRSLENSRLGRQWVAIREDELAAGCIGIQSTRAKLMAFAITAGICGIAGVLYSTKLETTAEPTTYDFNVSITVLCILIVGGMGSIRGVLVGSGIVMGFDILLKKVTEAAQEAGFADSTNVYLTPTNWKYLIFGLALVLMMRFRPEGVLPSSRIKEEMHEADAPPGNPAVKAI